ncbi:MAG TPA: PAS domain-containing protein [Verrucomicrobiae bacterium]|nr:PAS domain-containing protein [Verrucomicrobiae bacterium]
MKAIRPDKMPASPADPGALNGRAMEGLNGQPVVGAARHLEQENARLVEENAQLIRERDSFKALLDNLPGHAATEGKGLEGTMPDTHRLLEAILDNVPDRIYFKDTQSRFIKLSKSLAHRLGVQNPASAIGKTDFDFIRSESATEYHQDEQWVMQTGEPLINKLERQILPNGEIGWTSTTKVPLRDPAGKVVGLVGINRDITEQKRAEEALRQANGELEKRVAERTAEISRERLLLRTLVDNLPDYVYIKGPQGRFILANLAVARQMGFSSTDEIIGKTDFDLFPPELATRYRAEEEEMVRSGKELFNHEGPTVDASKRGKNRWVSTTKVILRDSRGEVTGFIGVGRDMTERKRMEELLAQERSLLRTLINNLPDSIYAKDSAGRKILANPADLKNLRCRTEAEAIGKTDFDLFPKEIAQKFHADDMKVIQGQPVINREEYFLDEEGKQQWLLTSKLPLRDQTGQIIGLVGVGRNITEQKQATEALKQSEERLREVMRSTRCILNCGEVEAPAGWRERVMTELTIFRWDFPVLNEEAAQEVFPLDVPPGKTYQQVWSESRNPDDFNEMHRVTRDAFLQDKPFYRNEFRCTDKHGIEHWMQEFITIHKLTENRWQIFGINTDITDLKKSENALRVSEGKLRQFTTQLERSNRELQDFAYVASHDLQEPLRKIVVFGERLKDQEGEKLDAQSRDYLERMQKAASRMQTLINDLLTFSRVTTKARPFAQVDLAQVARDVINDLEGRIELVGGRVEVGTLPLIDAEGLQMRQLFQNLIGNALKFRRPDVSPVVKVGAQIITGPSLEGGTTVARRLCRLTVSDNGIGFDEKYLDRIFNVFQRLHSRNEYEGTGMGLAIARKIVLFHHGEITAKSKPGEGTTFIVTLPVTHPKEPQNPGENHE